MRYILPIVLLLPSVASARPPDRLGDPSIPGPVELPEPAPEEPFGEPPGSGAAPIVARLGLGLAVHAYTYAVAAQSFLVEVPGEAGQAAVQIGGATLLIVAPVPSSLAVWWHARDEDVDVSLAATMFGGFVGHAAAGALVLGTEPGGVASFALLLVLPVAAEIFATEVSRSWRFTAPR